jgi:hypothetical protein
MGKNGVTSCVYRTVQEEKDFVNFPFKRMKIMQE